MWESPDQPAGRWHAEGGGPAQYLAGVERSLWVVDVHTDDPVRPNLPRETLVGSPGAYPQCQAEA